MTSRNYNRRFWLLALLIAVVAMSQTSAVRAGQKVHIGHILGMRSPLMTKDYRIALELMMKRVFAGFGVDIEATGFDTPEQGLDAFWRSEVDVIEISSLDYVLLPEAQQEKMKIVGVVNLSDSKFKKYSLLAAPGTTLDDLKGQPVTMIGRGEWNIGIRWLELEILEKYGKTSAEFFGEITIVDYEEPSNAILPAFFGKAKACLVMDHQTELLAELNPQIGERLKPVISSEDLLGVIFVIRADYGAEKIAKLQDSSQKLHTTPDGQQAFTLMKVDRMDRVEDKDLASSVALAKRMKKQDDAAIVSLPRGIDSEVAR